MSMTKQKHCHGDKVVTNRKAILKACDIRARPLGKFP